MEKKIGDENSGESRQLATNRLKEKLIWKIINNRMNLINSTSAASPVFLFSPLVVQKLNMNALTYCSKVKCWKCAVRRISPLCNTSWSVLPLHIFLRHAICHEVSSPSRLFDFGDWIFFMATVLQLKVAKRRLFEKVNLECWYTAITHITVSGFYCKLTKPSHLSRSWALTKACCLTNIHVKLL